MAGRRGQRSPAPSAAHGQAGTSTLLIDRYLPRYDFEVVHTGTFPVPPETCLRAARALDLLQDPVVRAVLGLRGLPDRLAARLTGQIATAAPAVAPPTLRVDDMAALGWVLLDEEPGTEVVLGQIGRPWKPAGAARGPVVAPGEFAAFDQREAAKIAFSLRVGPCGPGSSILTMQTRVAVGDPDSRRRFGRYWVVVGPFSRLIRQIALRLLAVELGREVSAGKGSAAPTTTTTTTTTTPAARTPRTSRTAAAAPAPVEPEEIATGVYLVATGRGLGASNVYLVASGSSWALIDSAWPHQGEVIKSSAESLFGKGARPASILLTHSHPDHAGSALELARLWDLPVHLHADELPLASGHYLPEFANPLDRWLVAPLLRVVPTGTREQMLATGSLEDVARPLVPGAEIPGLPGWECVPTPGHTPGHVSYYRRSDRVLVTGDAVLTVNLNSLCGLLTGKQEISGPPRIATWSWPMARQSVALLARLEPQVLAPGHGVPLAGAATATALRAFSDGLERRAYPRRTRPGGRPRLAPGLFKPVDYSQRTRYRRPPELYLRLQRLGPLVTALGLSPSYVVALEVPGRRTGLIRRTCLVRATYGGDHYLVALAGESEWVRNVRAAGGRVVVGARERHAARLVELPPEQRAPVILAYLLRAGRHAGSRAVASEAGYYFGVGADPSLDEIGRVAQYYPVFQIAKGDEDDSPRACPA